MGLGFCQGISKWELMGSKASRIKSVPKTESRCSIGERDERFNVKSVESEGKGNKFFFFPLQSNFPPF